MKRKKLKWSWKSMGNWALFFISMAVGVMLAVQLQSQAELEPVESREALQVRQELQEERIKQQQLREEIFRFQLLKKEYENARFDDNELNKLLKEELNKARQEAGFTVMEGEGLILHIDVPQIQQEVDPYGSRQNAYQQMIDDDLRSLADELFGNGASAVAINNQRLTANSTIRKVGSAIQVNTYPISLPITVKVLGEADLLISALMVSEIPGIYQSIGLEIIPEKVDRLVIPSYNEYYTVQYMARQKESE